MEATSMKTLTTLLTTAAMALVLSACSGMQKAEEASLYDRLGGKEAITAVVTHLWGVVSQDSRINHYFANTKPEAFGSQLVDFLCQGAGGPCTYNGQDMHNAHTGMNISGADFDALAEDIVISLDHFKVPEKEKNEVMAMLGGMKQAVINH
jgi:hemoglobin